MAITIQELLASDTISQAVDKINFNFDQLLLNGGGPVGPAGPLGPIGPTGGRGLRGSKWYEDPNVSATDPNTLIFVDVESDDNYLDADGSVWNYNGTLWTVTTVNLTGPQGASGLSAGFAYFGNNITTGQQSIYPTPSPNGIGAGATIANEGIPTLVVGAVVSSTVNPPSGVTLTNAYKIKNSLATSIDSPITAMFVHQKDSSANGITFHGGGAIAAENFEQDDISNLANIRLDADDKLQLNVPKIPTSPTNPSDLLAFSVNTLKSGQQYYSGKQIQFSTGNDSSLALASEISDFTITVNTSNTSNRAKFQVSTTDANSAALFQLGGNVVFPTLTTKTGKILLEGGGTAIVTGGDQKFLSSSNEYVFGGLPSVSGTGSVAFVTSDATGRLRTINLSGGGAIGSGVMSLDGGALNLSQGLDNRLVRWNGANKLDYKNWVIDDFGTLYPDGGTGNIGGVGKIQTIVMDSTADITCNSAGTNYLNIKSNALSGRGIQINDDIIVIGQTAPAQLSSSYTQSSLVINNINTSGTAYGGQIEFTKSLGSYAGSHSPTIIGPKSTFASDTRGRDDTLIIEGGTGFNDSGSGSQGRDLLLRGGQTPYSVGYGGDVYLAGGSATTATGAYNGSVLIGYDPYSGKPYSPKIVIGGSPSNSAGYVTIQQPADSVLPTASKEFGLVIENNRTQAPPSDDQYGGLKITTNNNAYAIEAHVATRASAFNAAVQVNDNVIISRDSVAAATDNGLTIGLKGAIGAIRISNENSTSTSKIEMYASKKGASLPGTFSNANFTMPIQGTVTLQHSSTLTGQDPEENIFASGRMTLSSTSGFGGSGTMYWQRIGRVIHCFGIVTNSGSSPGQRIYQLPMTGTSSPAYQNPLGTGVGYTGGSGGGAFKLVPLEVQAQGTNGFALKWEFNNNLYWWGQSAGTVTTNTASARFSFSYFIV